MLDTCKGCKEPIHHWHALLTVQRGPDAGPYHVGCFNTMTQERKRGQWDIEIDNRPREEREQEAANRQECFVCKGKGEYKHLDRGTLPCDSCGRKGYIVVTPWKPSGLNNWNNNLGRQGGRGY